MFSRYHREVLGAGLERASPGPRPTAAPMVCAPEARLNLQVDQAEARCQRGRGGFRLRGGRKYANLSAANGQRGSHGRLFCECCAVVRGVRREDGPGRSAFGVALREDLLRVRVRCAPHALGQTRARRSERANRDGCSGVLPLDNPGSVARVAVDAARRTPCSVSRPRRSPGR